jgi:hypothetical protein
MRQFITSLGDMEKKHNKELKRREERANMIQSNLKRDIRSRHTALVTVLDCPTTQIRFLGSDSGSETLYLFISLLQSSKSGV